MTPNQPNPLVTESTTTTGTPANSPATPAEDPQAAPGAEIPPARPTLIPILPEVIHVERGYEESCPQAPPQQDPPEKGYFLAPTSAIISPATELAQTASPDTAPPELEQEEEEEEEPPPPLRQLKERNAEDREWAYSLAGQMKQDQARETILKTLGIALGSNSTYTQFCNWQRRQRLWDHLAAAELQDVPPEEAFQKFGSSRAWLRDSLIKRGYALADLEQDVKLALKVAKVDLKDSANSRQWALAKFAGRNKIRTALDYFDQTCDKYPELRADWEAFKAKYQKATHPPPPPGNPGQKPANP